MKMYEYTVTARFYDDDVPVVLCEPTQDESRARTIHEFQSNDNWDVKLLRREIGPWEEAPKPKIFSVPAKPVPVPEKVS